MTDLWEPIKTAPANTPLLVGGWDTLMSKEPVWESTVAEFNDRYNYWELNCSGDFAASNDVPFTPTHWMHIPTPPARQP